MLLLAENNESSEVCGIIKRGRMDKLNRSRAVNVHKLLTYLLAGEKANALLEFPSGGSA